ncbi:4a-hydroxytetrahydrobiopterin dehydratase [Sphingobium sp.]|uniref:4a-hydroxytetrahydrobiopterin dehydratase n=1 Tax=Sphingobium sp. TaxID=1912891 RepID=UPI0028BDE7C9|nr:4a-hydroxytetrahydrobiopterin dehydratase [Sphingobium sp.]
MTLPLSKAQLDAALAELVDWTYDKERGALYRQIKFGDFSQAIGFMMRVALEAERADHHPEWSNVCNKVDIWLTTHDAGDVSSRDVALAHFMNRLAGSGS